MNAPEVRTDTRTYVPSAKTALLVIVVACACCAIFAYDRWREQHIAEFFSQALRGANSQEDVTVRGVLYSVRNGIAYRNGEQVDAPEALELAYEKSVARRDPLISLAGTDPNDMLSALTSLSQAAQGLAGIQKTADSAGLVRTALYPTDFLRDAANAERARITFLDDGDDTSATRYNDALRRAMDDYLTDIARYRSGFVAAVPDDIRSFSTAGLLITRSNVLAAIDALQSGMLGTRSRFNARLLCFAGDISQCDTGEITLYSPSVPDIPPPDGSDLVEAQAVRNVLVATIDQGVRTSGTLATAPLIQLDSSSCTIDSPTTPLFVIASGPSWITGAPVTVLNLMSDIRLNDTRTLEALPFDSYFASRDITYIPSDPLSQYECPYLEADYGNAFAVEEIAQAAQRAPLSAYASGAEKTQLKKLEVSLSSGLEREVDADSYVRDAVQLAQAPGASSALSDEAAQLSLLLKDPTAGFAQLIGKVAETEERNVYAQTDNGVPVDLTAETLFYYRSGLMSFFMSVNFSAVGDTGPLLKLVDVPSDEQPYLYYSELPSGPTTTAEVIHDLLGYFQVHRALNASSTPTL